MSDLVLVEKKCTGCGQLKLLSEFYRNKQAPDGYQWQCKDCVRPKMYAAQARRKARIGDEEYRRLNRLAVQLARTRGTVDPRPNRARVLALWALARNHPDEYDALARIERAKLGLNPDPNRLRTENE